MAEANSGSKTESQEPEPREEETPRHGNVRHSTPTLDLKGVAAVLGAIAVTFAAGGALAWWILTAHGRPIDRSRARDDYRTAADPLPPEPRLEAISAAADHRSSSVFARQLASKRRLTTYGETHVDAYVHIPIGRAIEIASQRLPSHDFAKSDPEKRYGLLGGGEPNSGRIYRGPPQWFHLED